MSETAAKKFVSGIAAAHQLGVPAAWLKREAEEKRLPHIKVGRSLRFNVLQVSIALNARAQGKQSLPADLVDLPVAAELLEVQPALARRWAELGHVPSYAVADDLLFSRSELSAWLSLTLEGDQ